MKPNITKELLNKYTKYQIDKIRNHMSIMKQCGLCGTEFDAKSYIFRPTAIYERVNEFCSDECKKHGAGRKNKKYFEDQVCKECNTKFTPSRSRPHQKFCSRKCYYSFYKGKPRPGNRRWLHKIKPPKNSISQDEKKWLSQFDITHTQHIIKLPTATYRVDGYDEVSNTVYEYLGSFWHGNPNKYDPNDINPVNKQKFGDLFEHTINRLYAIEEAGYKLVVQWGNR